MLEIGRNASACGAFTIGLRSVFAAIQPKYCPLEFPLTQAFAVLKKAQLVESFPQGLALKVSDFHFDLPEELIAHYPAKDRSASRLLHLNSQSGQLDHGVFPDLLNYLRPGDLLIFNNTRVMAARLYGHKPSGGKVELLVERVIDGQLALAMLKSSKPARPGLQFELDTGILVEVVERREALYLIRLVDECDWNAVFERIGHMPLPPYIKRDDEKVDEDRYQTVYSEKLGAVAAPTAGLHFDQAMMSQLKERSIDIGFVTLHVGLGTFLPVRVDSLEEHIMHSEWMELTADLVEKINLTRRQGGRVIAVGTTSVRCLESAAKSGALQAYCGETDIFIYPGYQFQVVDALLTNFHLSQSTLIMLVAAFA
ncbi:MAG: tRNA preQ1(34) S-adenosylmethionine ribosyltransferase-isomerase QueA, partial [Gammaproteobacteria bacterium]